MPIYNASTPIARRVIVRLAANADIAELAREGRLPSLAVLLRRGTGKDDPAEVVELHEMAEHGELRFPADPAQANGVLRRAAAKEEAKPGVGDIKTRQIAHPLLRYLASEIPEGGNPDRVAEILASWEAVDFAYVEPRVTSPAIVNADDDPLGDFQSHLDPAPWGVDARFAWEIAGGAGQGVRCIDIEHGWKLDHDDLTAGGVPLLGGLNTGYRGHGTEVLGTIAAVDNTEGGVGVVPHIRRIGAVGLYRPAEREGAIVADVAGAILTAASSLQRGDVILIEAQLIMGKYENIPAECDPRTFDAIAAATDAGITVIEPAGNGDMDLGEICVDGRHILGPTERGGRDSGAIMVAGATSSAIHQRSYRSNYGARVDCYAWGENVVTTNADHQSNAIYTARFGGTSAASAIIAGAACALQGAAKRFLGRPLTPAEVRAVMSHPNLGTRSPDPIGVMPNLRRTLCKMLQSYDSRRFFDKVMNS